MSKSKRKILNMPKTRHAHAARLQPCFRASLQSDGTLEMLVYEDIGYNYWTDGGVTAKTVKQQLDNAGVFSRIAVRINSPGGDAFEGSAILSLLKAQKKPVDVFVDGIAASAASIIAMAGDTITMGRTAMMMVHNAWTFCAGNADDLRQCADVLDKISTSIGQAYVDKTGKTSAQIKDIMDAETWMSAQECVDEGFATAIAAEEDDGDAAMALARSFKSLAKMKKVPAALQPKASSACGCECAACAQGDCADCDVEDCDVEDCDHGEMEAAASNLSQYEARLRLLRV
jgi:ATP-dependent protease ClpP protease subunit